MSLRVFGHMQAAAYRFFTSYLAINRASRREIAEERGHKSPKVVKRYAHLLITHNANVLNSMSQLFSEPQGSM